MSKVIGIDLGTTNSCVAIVEGKTPKVITNEEGSRTTPSVVAYTGDDDRLVGASARRQAITNPENTIFSIKRFMGMNAKEAKKEAKKVPYNVISGNDGSCKIKVNNKNISPPEISAQTLLKLKRSAENYLGQQVTEAVITVPAYFNDSQRQATKDAGKIAGLDVKRIINEPTAAALAYGMESKGDQKIVVFDLGGGTFDVSVLEISEGLVEVMSTNGDTHLGGDDIDQILIDHFLSTFKSNTGMDVSKDTMVLQRLKDAAEKAKIELSSAQKTEINLPFLTADSTGPKHLVTTINRSTFEQMIASIVSRTLGPVKSALSDADLDPSDIDEIILVGGSTRIPIVRDTVEKHFGKQVNSSVNPDEVVALGAAVQGGVFSGDVNDILLLDVTPLSLGIETLGGICTKLIDRNTTIPCSKSETFSTAADNQSAVDVNVLQGEREFAKDNRTLGQFNFDGIPPAPRGVPQIEVTFDIDANGIVNVSAKDKATGKEQSITITGDGSLTDEEISAMVDSAKENEDSDREKIKLVENRNKLDTLIYQSQKMVDESNDKLSDDTKSRINIAISESKDALDSDDITIIENGIKSLESAIHFAGEELYSDISNEESEENDDDEIIDADFENV
jgi:molecular chaperone DnaK